MKVFNFAKRSVVSESGAAMIEYVLLASLIAVSLVGVVSIVKESAHFKFRTAAQEIGNAGSIGGCPGGAPPPC